MTKVGHQVNIEKWAIFQPITPDSRLFLDLHNGDLA